MKTKTIITGLLLTVTACVIALAQYSTNVPGVIGGSTYSTNVPAISNVFVGYSTNTPGISNVASGYNTNPAVRIFRVVAVSTNIVTGSTNTLITYGGLTNYGSSFIWNPNWQYLGFQNELITGGWTNSTGYYVGADEDGTYIDQGCSGGTQNPTDCDGAYNEDYIDLHGSSYFGGGANDVTNGWTLGTMTFQLPATNITYTTNYF